MTDHQPAVSFMEQKTYSRTQTRWLKSGYFESIRPTLQYLPGKANVVADDLSRSFSVHDASVANVQTTAVPCVDESERDAWLHSLNTDLYTRDVLVKLHMDQSVRGYSVHPSGVLYYQPEGGERRIVVPTSQQQRILEEHHDVPTAGHLGVERSLEILQRIYWWKGMRRSVKEYVRTCPSARCSSQTTRRQRDCDRRFQSQQLSGSRSRLT
jgi:hypothetical protein